jgi:hypothetical protein
MITTYLRLDLFDGDDNFTSFDLDIKDNVISYLQEPSYAKDADYAELILVSEFGYNRDVSLVARFRRSKIKGKKDHQWILTKEIFTS